MTASILERDNHVPPAEGNPEIPRSDQGGRGDWQSMLISRRELQETPRLPSPWRHPLLAGAWAVQAGLAIVCLVALLSIGASIPLVNILVLGYLMEVQGRVARSGKFRSAWYLLPAARRLGGMLLAIWLWLLPIQFLADVSRDSWLLAPGGWIAWAWISLLAATTAVIAGHLVLAIACGGSWWRFLRPVSNARWIWARRRTGEYWQIADHSIREFVAASGLPQLLRLGLLGYAAAYLWLVVPALLFSVLNDPTNRWQVMGFLIGCAALTLTLIWLPMLLAHVAATGRWRAMLEPATALKLAGRTPFCWALATAILFACSVLPLLYWALFKNRIPPHDARWDLMLVFLVTVMPARVLVGRVYHRATTRPPTAPRWRWRIW